MITSAKNHQLKEIRRLARRPARERSGRFVAEGEDLVDAARAAGWTPAFVLCPPGHSRDGGYVEVAPELLRTVSTLASSSRAIAVYEQRWADPAGPLCVYLHGVRDAGNVGTILRAAHAFGAASVVLGPGCADPYGPRAVRASMGAVFALPLARTDGVDGLPGELVALDGGADVLLRGPRKGPLTLLVGAERTGLPAEIIEASDRRCAIPQLAGDSLNAAMAATVALYELSRVPAS